MPAASFGYAGYEFAISALADHERWFEVSIILEMADR